MSEDSIVQIVTKILKQKLQPINEKLESLERQIQNIQIILDEKQGELHSYQNYLKVQVNEFHRFKETFLSVQKLAECILEKTDEKIKEVEKVSSNQCMMFQKLESKYQTQQVNQNIIQSQIQQSQFIAQSLMQPQLNSLQQNILFSSKSLQIVYKTQTGEKYHRRNCKTIENSKVLQQLTLQQAEKFGITRCMVCNP